jgi:hypothetical protein
VTVAQVMIVELDVAGFKRMLFEALGEALLG